MARCGGCGASGQCSCTIVSGDAIYVSGSGTDADPYRIRSTAPTREEFDDLVDVVATLPTRDEFDLVETEISILQSQVRDLMGLGSGNNPVIEITFDDGVQGQVLQVGGYFRAVTGLPTYDSAASKYPTGLGVMIDGPAGRWGSFSMPSQNALASQLRFYIKPITIPSRPLSLLKWQSNDVITAGMGWIILNANLTLSIVSPGEDGSGSTGPNGTTRALIANQWNRVNIQTAYDGVRQTVQIQTHCIDPEGSDQDGPMAFDTYECPSPDNWKIGSGSGDADWKIAIDGLGIQAGLDEWIPAFQPSLPSWLHEYEAGNDRTLVLGDNGTEDAIAIFACQSLIAAKAHGMRGLRTTAGYAEYPLRNQFGGTFSVYARRVATGAAQSKFIDFLSGLTSRGSVGMKTGGTANVVINNGGGTTQATTTGAATTGAYGRYDVAWQWSSASGGTLDIWLRCEFDTATGGDGTTYDPTLHVTLTSTPQPDRVRLGFQGLGWIGDIDSHRENPNIVDVTYFGPIDAPINTDVLYQASGWTGRTSGEAKIQTSGYAQVWLATSSTRDGTTLSPNGTITYLGPVTPDANGFSTFTWSGATPLAYKYMQPSSDGSGTLIGTPMEWSAAPADSTDFSDFRFAVTSCQMAAANEPILSGTMFELCWKDMLTWRPRMHAFIGDGGYWGHANSPSDTPATLSGRWLGWAGGMPVQKKVIGMFPSRWQKDDHEVRPGNRDSGTGPGQITVEKLNNVEGGMPYIFPFGFTKLGSQFGDTYGHYRRFLAGYEMISNEIEVLYVDCESMQRSTYSDPDVPGTFGLSYDGTAKTFLGQEQDAAWETYLTGRTAPKLTIVIMDKSWLGRQDTPFVDNDWDKIWNYSYWREWFGDLLATNCNNVVQIGGDRHFNAYAPGDYNPWGGFPCYISSGLSQHSLMVTKNELYTGSAHEGYTLHDNVYKPKGGYQKQVIQYVQFVLSRSGSSITLNGQSRYVVNNWDGTGDESSQWSDWLSSGIVNGFSATDVFT